MGVCGQVGLDCSVSESCIVFTSYLVLASPYYHAFVMALALALALAWHLHLHWGNGVSLYQARIDILMIPTNTSKARSTNLLFSKQNMTVSSPNHNALDHSSSTQSHVPIYTTVQAVYDIIRRCTLNFNTDINISISISLPPKIPSIQRNPSTPLKMQSNKTNGIKCHELVKPPVRGHPDKDQN